MLTGAFRGFRSFIRANFLAGVFVAVPFAITVGFLVWLWGRLQAPLERFFNLTMNTTEKAPWTGIVEAIERSDAGPLLIPVISLIILVMLVLLLGIIARSIIGRIAISAVEGMVGRLPLIGMLYKSLKQLSEAVMGSDGESKFQRAVAVQFPYKGVWAIGFVTGRGGAFIPKHALLPNAGSDDLLTVFIPTTPLPTAGFMVVVPENETIELDIPVQDALKLVVSGGMLDSKDSGRTRQQSKLTQVINQGIEAAKPAEQKG
jgi:uncharacterized membrane protein